MSEIVTQRDNGSPFHRGERLVQSRLGVRDIEPWARKVVRDHLPEQHKDFYIALPFLVVAARDQQGRPWVTLLEGPEGFVSAPIDLMIHSLRSIISTKTAGTRNKVNKVEINSPPRTTEPNPR